MVKRDLMGPLRFMGLGATVLSAPPIVTSLGLGHLTASGLLASQFSINYKKDGKYQKAHCTVTDK